MQRVGGCPAKSTPNPARRVFCRVVLRFFRTGSVSEGTAIDIRRLALLHELDGDGSISAASPR